MPHKDQLSQTMLDCDTAAIVTEIVAMGVIEAGTIMQQAGWTYLHQNSRYDVWNMYEVYVGGQTHTLRAESARHIQQWCAKKFVVGAHYAITLVTRTEVLDGVVTIEEKLRFG
jgi:hypothetical protein